MNDALFRDLPRQVSIVRQIECVDREIGYRRHVYPRRVMAGHMTRELMDTEIAVMEAVRDTLKNLQVRGIT